MFARLAYVRVGHLKDASFGYHLALLANIRLGWESLPWKKHSSRFFAKTFLSLTLVYFYYHCRK
jgi:hypothetical protein